MPESEDRRIAVMLGVAANDNPGSGAGAWWTGCAGWKRARTN